MFDEHEPAESELTPDLAAIERRLARLTPAAPRIDRDRLMFAAGQAAAGRTLPEGFLTEPRRLGNIAGPSRAGELSASPSRAGGWYLPVATATMPAATLLLVTMLAWQRTAQPIAVQSLTPPQPTTVANAQPAQSVDATASATPSALQSEQFGWPMASPPTTGYLGLRYIALTRGVGELETHNRTAGSDSDSIGNTPATQRELLRELLPAANRDASPRS
jgi:hypothetical protein